MKIIELLLFGVALVLVSGCSVEQPSYLFLGGGNGGGNSTINNYTNNITNNITNNFTTINNFTSDDGNNYTTSINVTGTTNKRLNLSRLDMPDLTADWTDYDTDTNDTGLYYTKEEFNTQNISNQKLIIDYKGWTNTTTQITTNYRKIGIGTQNPIQNLVINGSGAQDFVIWSSTSMANVAIHLWRGNLSGDGYGSRDIINNAGDLIFIEGINSGNTTHMIIKDATGNVGIGTSTPSSKLQISGSANITGRVYGNYSTLNATPGYTGTCTILGLTSITVVGGIITGCT